ncbi:MAG: aspartate kinase [Propionibacteriaceae bacterium]|jgi:aspartate kinase|nr:aspartate kinase [Propionibacteriaceae bacterium]
MGIKVAKFGGSSLASGEQIAKAVAIITADPDRRYVVASAPGKRSADDIKVTDLLYQLWENRNGSYQPILAAIKQRFADIEAELGVEIGLDAHLAHIEDHLTSGVGPEYYASRGEYLNSMLLAAHLGWKFVDSANVVRFTAAGPLDADQTEARLVEALAKYDRAVIPGFYGATEDGVVKTFSRGGSDVTGALVARAARAEVYENWTDVSGILVADPRIVKSPPSIERVTYVALRELTYLGATVLHEDAITPVRERGIPINIRNTNEPTHSGTWIEATPPVEKDGPAILGVAGKPGYTAVTIHKAQWAGTFGIATVLLRLFADARVAVDLALTGVDTWTIVVPSATLAPALDSILASIRELFAPDTLDVRADLTLMGIVESGSAPRGWVTARLADALVTADIPTHAIAFTGDLHVLAIDTSQYQKAVRAIYSALAETRVVVMKGKPPTPSATLPFGATKRRAESTASRRSQRGQAPLSHP